MTTYNSQFYEQQSKGSLDSAREVVPLVLELIRPSSVVDVGCGVGTWLSVYLEKGISDIVGIDGDYVDRGKLHINSSHFFPKDLSKPFSLDRKFDLVQSLEVAEHIDEQYADVFVENLAALGDVILFSAAIPHQLGTNHVNERFIDYWSERFSRHEFDLVDVIRPSIWKNQKVEVWYRQNIVIFAKPRYIGLNLRLAEGLRDPHIRMTSVVHPQLYSTRIAELLQALMQCALQFQKDNRNELAIQLSEMILHFSPRSGKGWDLSGQLEAQRRNLNGALQKFQKAVSLEPANAMFISNLALILDALGDKQGARQHFQRALELNPSLHQVRERLDALNASQPDTH